MTATSSKSPRSGTRSFDASPCARPHSSTRRRSPSTLREVRGEARGGGAVDDAVVVATATAAASGAARTACRPTRASSRDFDTPRIATSGALMIGVKRGAADAAERADREAAALHVGRAELACRAPSPLSSPSSFAMLEHALAGRTSRITGTTRPFGVSAAKPMWKYFLSTRFSPPLERGVEVRELLQRARPPP